VNNVALAIQFFLQIAVILAACQAVGAVAVRLGQPRVVAEMIAGVALGPSLLGWLAPQLQAALFPWDPAQQARDTQSYLFPAAQLGLALYMFIVGMEFRVDALQNHFRSAVAVSLAGMAAPFALGASLAWLLLRTTQLFPPATAPWEAMLFLGASMCITAFPMLARIIHHKGLTGTLMGTVAIGAGAVDDATAWCLLALVLASFDNDPQRALVSIAGGAAFVAGAFLVVRPLLKRLRGVLAGPDDVLTETGMAAGLTCMALGAWCTDRLHLHAVFGAFVMGTVMPRGGVARGLTAKIQPLAVALLLPLFFTFSGLHTRIDLLDSAALWGACLLVLAAAILGKGVACSLAARLTGLTWRESLGIGTLMNARGLMELIIINIGLERGLISRELFSVLVVMAIVTTLMASPIFDLVVRGSAARQLDQPAERRSA
jgi:Kef-type K+ transport system membrane component KefB